MSAEAVVEQYVANAIEQGNTALDKASNLSDQAITAATNFFFPSSLSPLPVPNITLPPFNPFDEDLTGLFDSTFGDVVNDLDPKLHNEIKDFLNTYFPDFTGCLKTAVPNWLCGVIQNGYSGIPAGVEAQIWQRDRDRLTESYLAAREQAATQWAGRGFALPGGFLLDAIQRADQTYQHESSEASRNTAIEMMKIQVDMVKFAIETAVRYRLGIVQALVSYLNTWMEEYKLGIEAANAKINAKTQLWNMANAYLQALVTAEELKTKVREINLNAILTSDRTFADASSAAVQARAQAAVGAATAMGQAAAAVLGTQNTLAHIGNETSQSL